MIKKIVLATLVLFTAQGVATEHAGGSGSGCLAKQKKCKNEKNVEVVNDHRKRLNLSLVVTKN